jgi:putative redox protein
VRQVTEILVDHIERDRFRVRVREHELVVDQPTEAGGDDAGPTPTELFVAGLASCVAFYAERFLGRHSIPSKGLRVESGFEMAEDRPPRVDRVWIRVSVPVALSCVLRTTLERVVDQCTVHNSLREPPAVLITVAESVAVAA